MINMKEHQMTIMGAFQSSTMNIMLTILILMISLALIIASTASIIKRKKRHNRNMDDAYIFMIVGIGIMAMTVLFSGIYTFKHASNTNVSGKETVTVKETLVSNNGDKSWTFKSKNGHTYEIKNNRLNNDNQPTIHTGDKVMIHLNNVVMDKNRAIETPTFDDDGFEYQVIKTSK